MRKTPEAGGLNVLYGNGRVRCVQTHPLNGTLVIKTVCFEGEEQTALYQQVLYSQIDQAAEGKRMAIAVELTPEELRGGKHRQLIKRFQADCGLENMDVVEEMILRGYRFFAHYIGASDELLIVAKGLQIT